MPFGDWRPPPGWTYSDAHGWQPPAGDAVRELFPEQNKDMAAALAEIERLTTLVADLVDVLSEARSGYIAGSGPDEAWDKRRDRLVAASKRSGDEQSLRSTEETK